MKALVDSIQGKSREESAGWATKGPREVHGLSCDARKEDQVKTLISKVETSIGPIQICIHNIGANVYFPLHDTTSRVYFKVWEMVAFSAFIVGREVSKKMVGRKEGTIIFTGATASVRGTSGFSAFSGGMTAKRSLA